MKKICLLLISLFLLLLTSCQEDEIGQGTQLQKGRTLFTVSLSEPVVSTRAGWGEPGSEPIENLHVLVFDENGFFVANSKAEIKEQNASGGTFAVNLPVSNNLRRLHFVANYDEESYGAYSSTDSESSVVGAMTTSNEEGAYWGMVEVGYIPDQSEGWNLGQTVSLVRNFAKITLNSTAVGGSFVAEGYAIFNTSSSGLVAPYNPENGTFADCVTPTDYVDFVEKNTDYEGVTQGEINENAPTDFISLGQSVYVYERNQDNSDIPTSLIVKGAYNGTTCYYKLDIVSFNADTYETTTYNLYRNFHYNINITNVRSAGYATIEEAMAAAASNNLSASIQVSNVKEISDGNYTLGVSLMDTLIVTSDPLEITYHYKGREGDLTSTEQVKVNFERNENAFSSITYEKGIITLTPVASLPEIMETQEIVVATESGLNRRIVVRVRKPYKFVATDCQQRVKEEIQAPFTFIMELPSEMPSSIFPITLQLDLEKNTLYPDASRNLMPVKLTGNRDYVYDLKVDYNTYRQNRTIYCHFKSNTASSATSIVAKGKYFEESEEESFINEDPLDFSNITFNGVAYNSTNPAPTIPFGTGQTGTLQFRMNLLPDESVRIFTRYLTEPVTDTGKIRAELNSEGSVVCYLYEPLSATTPVQIIRFKSKGEIAAETIELFSEYYAPLLIPYTNPYVNVLFTYGNDDTPVRNGVVKVYTDKYYQNYTADLAATDTRGKTVMRSFAGNTRETTLYFLYTAGQTSYRGEALVGDLIDQGDSSKGGEITINLKVR
ncbi:fimbria major subunit [Bacteroides fluxus]|uniref:Conserved domain protein n=1 Tax=Bacteroides fluxus YIT 12057 TaxID=763034 RepID=F3PWH9_9BACE|nr:fimbria major subunit [Bacteroides fluxus]EGF51908.1 conserved domain protein [Bacteroides fluxus YIT 12057]